MSEKAKGPTKLDKQDARLKDDVQALMKKHGTRSLLAAIVEVLDGYRKDEIDKELIKTLDYAGRTYASAMGLQWWAETTLND